MRLRPFPAALLLVVSALAWAVVLAPIAWWLS